MSNAKPYEIPKRLVWNAWLAVKANRGAAGVDGQTIDDFEANLEKGLYKIWNRMSSGSYMPPMVKRVEIVKSDGKMRPLGIPTVADRIAQMVVKSVLEPQWDPHFHPSSFGYRPRKSAHDAVRQAKANCWKYSWVIDLDIKGFFDNLDHDLLMKAVRHKTDNAWAILYIERWLKAGIVFADATCILPQKGTPLGFGFLRRSTSCVLQSRVVLSARYWPIFFCMWCSINGCTSIIRRCYLSVMRTILLSIARREHRRKNCTMPLHNVWRRVV